MLKSVSRPGVEVKTEPQVTPCFVMEKEELFEEQQTPGEPAANGGQSAVENVTWNNGAVISSGRDVRHH
ncbi:unnamed protein product [Lota lota]